MTTERMSRLEGAYEQVDKRLEDLNQSMTSLKAEMNEPVGSHEQTVRRHEQPD